MGHVAGYWQSRYHRNAPCRFRSPKNQGAVEVLDDLEVRAFWLQDRRDGSNAVAIVIADTIGFGTSLTSHGFDGAFSFFREVRRFWDLAPYLTDKPFNALRPLMIFPLVKGVGLGYLVLREVLFSVWFFYLVLKLVALIGVGIFGWEKPAFMSIGYSFPFPHSKRVGGYLAMAVLLLW